MQITFESVRFQNFLSFGTTPTEINLASQKSTLVTGTNFSGKSSAVLDTITFALFGKAFRQINKPQLINMYNGKECLVELYFNKNNVKYLIRRGLKPNIFEIFKDGNKLDIDASAKDQQVEFEKNILNFTYQTFQQIVVLGSANYIPFMRLKPNERRLVVDDILNLHVFTKMSDKLKTEIAETKSELQTTTNQLFLKEELLNSKKEHLEALSNVNVSTVDESLIKEIQNENKKLELEINKKELELRSFTIEEEYNTSDLDKELNKYEKVKNKIMFNVETQKKTYDFFLEHSNCPTCHQKIEEDFRKNQIESIKEKILEKKEGVQQLIEKISEFKKTKDEYLILNKNIVLNKKRQTELTNSISSLENKIEANHEKISILRNPSTLDLEKITKTKNEISDIENTIKELKCNESYYNEETEIQKNCSILLKDSGIKATIMNKYLKLLNQNMEIYLKRFGLKLNFELQNSFDEKITNFSGHEFSYFSLSEGEKLRVDLAMMFSWRNLASKRAKMKTNLLILDEVMDGAADAFLQQELIDLLNDMTFTNFFVISHRSDGLQDKFDRNLHVERNTGFSIIKEHLL